MQRPMQPDTAFHTNKPEQGARMFMRSKGGARHGSIEFSTAATAVETTAVSAPAGVDQPGASFPLPCDSPGVLALVYHSVHR